MSNTEKKYHYTVRRTWTTVIEYQQDVYVYADSEEEALALAEDDSNWDDYDCVDEHEDEGDVDQEIYDWEDNDEYEDPDEEDEEDEEVEAAPPKPTQQNDNLPPGMKQ